MADRGSSSLKAPWPMFVRKPSQLRIKCRNCTLIHCSFAELLTSIALLLLLLLLLLLPLPLPCRWLDLAWLGVPCYAMSTDVCVVMRELSALPKDTLSVSKTRLIREQSRYRYRCTRASMAWHTPYAVHCLTRAVSQLLQLQFVQPARCQQHLQSSFATVTIANYWLPFQCLFLIHSVSSAMAYHEPR